MEEDLLIRVLYYRNPHLFWVEVKSHDAYTLRQVGLFGVVPTQASIVEGERVCMKSDRWDPRANDIVEDFLEGKHLSFKTTYRLDDEQSSIFNNPHIFGEIFSAKKGVKKQLSNCLDSSVYAYKSKNEFWQMLDEGKIKTKLDYSEEIDVLENIIIFYKEKGIWHKRKSIFLKHLSPSQLSKINKLINEESPDKLTVENLEKHRIMTDKSNNPDKYISLIEKPERIAQNSPARSKKYQDFNCGDKLAPVEFVENVIKKYTVVEKSPDIVEVSKKYTVREDVRKTGSERSKITVYDEEINPDSGDEISMNGFQRTKGRANSHQNRSNKEKSATNERINELKIKDKFKQHNIEHKYSPDSSPSHKDKSSNSSDSMQKVHKELKNKKTQKEICDSFDRLEMYKDTGINTSPAVKYIERLVAYGPPTNNQQSLVRKTIRMKIEDAPKKQDFDEDDKIQWSKDDSFDFNEELCENNPKLDVNYKSHKKIVTDNIDGVREEVSGKKYNLNDPKDYNDFIQGKQDHKVKDRMFCNDNNEKEKNDILYTNNREHQNPTKPKSKLLDKIRKRNDRLNDSSSTDDNSVKNENLIDIAKPNALNDTDSDEELERIHAILQPNKKEPIVQEKQKITVKDEKTEVNPIKNLDGSKSVFVENLVQPLLLAHAKNNKKVFPRTNMRDVPFKIEIKNTLRNMQIREPLRLQSVSWSYILEGHSLFMISPPNSGKTLGYLPAVCNLVLDYNYSFSGLGPICIIVCATAVSVASVGNMCKMFVNKKVIQCFPGLNNTSLLVDIVNGCDILVSTPSMLYRLLGEEIGVDLRRLTTIVFDDCEFITDVYKLEIKAIQIYVKQMLKSRIDKQVKVQYILASRKWSDMMEPLAKKSPNTIMVFTAFHECVLYSKTKTSVSFVKKNNKIDAVVDFLKETDDSKLTVIVCRSDDEVDLLESTLVDLKFNVVACNNQMTIHDLYKIRSEKLTSILICCDGNLKQLNVTYANYLVHFSMPAVYTQFCARFSVLNDNYPSIFGSEKDDVKIKILLEETNAEQLPKILNFVKRCSDNIPEVLQEVARKVLEQKDLEKAELLVPICDHFFSFGECVNMDVCQCRHTILERYDEPKVWMPRNGVITFKIIHYHSATLYSARLLTHSVGADKTKYTETYGTLCLKLGMFFSKEDNKRLHGEPNVGDICAVPIRKNFIARCRVLKINSYEKGKAKSVVIQLIDEEQIEVVRAVELYFLPEKFRSIETHVVKVQLAGVRPQDKDVTFSELALNKLKKITDDDEDLYLRGNVAMTIGNTIMVSSLEACAELTALCETVVKHDFKRLLLTTHAIPHPEHLSKLQKLCDIGNLRVNEPKNEMMKSKPQAVKKNVEHRWAHLDKNDWTDIIFSNTINPSKFFVRPQKFSKCIDSLISDIKKHVAENPKAVEDIAVRDVVLAEFPDDSVYERAMVDEIIDENKVKCFFVDNADWRDISKDKIKPIPQKFVKQIPFQSIECRLVGVKPPGENWTEFSTNWLHDNCLEDLKGNSKRLFVKYFTKEPAELTGGHKYGVVLVDTTEDDVIINKKMIELNLVAVKDSEIEYLDKPLDFVRDKTDTSSYDELDELENKQETQMNDNERPGSKNSIAVPIKMISNETKDNNWAIDVNHETKNDKIIPYIPQNNDHVDKIPLKNVFADKPIRSIPLVSESDDDTDKWDVCFEGNLGECFGLQKLSQSNNHNISDDSNEFVAVTLKDVMDTPNIPAIADKSIEDNVPKPTKEYEKVGTNVGVNDKTSEQSSEEDKSQHKKISPEVMESASKRLKLLTKRLKKDTETRSNKLDIAVVESTNVDILKGEIKDVSLYDSDDTLSITTFNDKIEITMGPNKVHNKEISVLDSDDTQSVSTLSIDFGKDIVKEPNKKVLDSDDSESEDAKPRIVEIHDEAKTLVENNKGDLNNVGEQIEAKTDFKGKVIPIKEITKETYKHENKVDEYDEKKSETNTVKNIEQEHKDNESMSEMRGKTITVTHTTEPTRTPQLVWKQDKSTITIKIKVVVDEYTLETGNRSLKFSAYQNEVKYAFDIELYGVIENNKTTHSNKGQYILVTLSIMLKRTTRWLKLTKDYKNWIVYDVDSINTSSDEETPINNDALKIIMDKHERALEDDDDDDIDDTSGFRYND